MKILLIGKNCQIGSQLTKLLPELGELTAIGREECDLTDRIWLRTTIRLLGQQLIVNAAAYSDLDQAEQDPDMAWSVNAGAPALVTDEAALSGAGLVHYSTDYVFDGENREPYVEQDEPNPLYGYGASKLDGERLIQNTGAAALILRTSWVYGLGGDNYAEGTQNGVKSKRLC